jgi:phytoene synthase
VSAAHGWEKRLLSLARQGMGDTAPLPAVEATPERLEQAYAKCDAITAEHSRTFHFASSLLPRDKRRGARALYGFCRITDDTVDRLEGDAAGALAQWRRRATSPTPPEDDLVLLAWAKTRAAYRIPACYAEQLIDGVAQDLTTTRYPTFEELACYCYGVASTVGLMSMHIIGFAGPGAVPHAVKMGVALQMTNILRDVGEDWRSGRVYLPQDELATHGLSDTDIEAGCVDDRWRKFMRFQIDRNRAFYRDSWPGIALLHHDGQFAIAAAADLYSAILTDIEANDFDVFHRRAHIGLWGKIRRLPAIWWRLRRLRARANHEV